MSNGTITRRTRKRTIDNLAKRYGEETLQAVLSRLMQQPYGNGAYSDVARIMGVSRERARQIAEVLGAPVFELHPDTVELLQARSA